VIPYFICGGAVLWAGLVTISAYRQARTYFEVGVLHGFMLGRFPEAAYADKRFEAAAVITDRLEADVAWDLAQKE
jgi:hypothetical protein